MALAVAAATVLAAAAALAFPDGAPWGAANPAAEEHCATCHFSADPVRESDALVISGLPQRPRPDAVYKLEIRFDDPDIVIAGFQLIAHAAPDRDVGALASSEPDIECIGGAARSTAPSRNHEPVTWAVEWRAPEKITLPIVFHVAASAANDDGSPLGDTIHYRAYELHDDR